MTAFPKYERYKDSGVEWLGEIPAGWDVHPICAVSKPKSVRGCPDRELLSVYLDRGVIKFSDVDEKRTNATSTDLSNYQAVDPGDFVLNNQQAWRGSVGVSTHEGIVSPAYIILSLSDRWNSAYANYLFRDSAMVSQYLIYSKGVGTIQRNLYYPDFKRASVILPPKPEQDRIVTFLDSKTAEIDALIAKKQRQIELLDEQKAILINRAVTKGIVNAEFGMRNEHLSPPTHSTFTTHNSKFIPSGIEWIGKIPEHWKVMKLRRTLATSPKNGISPPGSPTGGTPTLSIAAVKGGVVTFGDNVKYADISRREAATYEISEGDILALRGNGSRHLVATCGIVGPDAPSGCIYPDLLIKLVPDKVTNPCYFVNLMNGPLRDGIELAAKTSAGIWKVSGESLSSLSVPQPPLEEQEAIVEHISEIAIAKQASEDSLIKQIESLKTLRSTLIAHAVTGRIKV